MRQEHVTFGWRMPMWDPAGTKLDAWIPAVRQHLAELPRDVFQTVWMSDHLVPGTGWAPPEWDTLECVTALIHFASLHPEYRYGQIVLGNSYRPPALLGKMFSTLQALTDARLILGIGAGWMESEYRMYGYPYPPPRVRFEELEEAIQLIRKQWTEQPATFEGKHYRLDNCYAEPRPNPIPIVMIGASGEQLGLRAVARHADWWNCTAPTPEEMAAKRAVLAEHCRKVGRDVDDIVVNWQCQVVAIGQSEAEAQRIADAAPLHQRGPRGSVVGTPDQVYARLKQFVDVGVRDFNLRFADFPRMDGALTFAREIAPRFG
jgi:alkanesulfonate monooxygenase SsuD/methylene tetrahydromethanopterin reductase-like flavin-dependent oxidoreductase (luciferase family)